MATRTESNESTAFRILKAWHLYMACAIAFITPVVTATGAYYGLREKALADKAEVTERVSKLELDAAKTFADKTALENLDARTQRMQNDITEIKTILKSKLR